MVKEVKYMCDLCGGVIGPLDCSIAFGTKTMTLKVCVKEEGIIHLCSACARKIYKEWDKKYV